MQFSGSSSSSSGVYDGNSIESSLPSSSGYLLSSYQDDEKSHLVSSEKFYNSIESSFVKEPVTFRERLQDTFFIISGEFRDDSKKSTDIESPDLDPIVEAIIEERKSPTITILLSIWTMITGLSVFALPYFASRIGLAFTPVLIIVPIVMGYTATLIRRCLYDIDDNTLKIKEFRSYYDIGESTIKKRGKSIMIFLSVLNILPNIYRLIFCASVTVNLFQRVANVDIKYWMIFWIALSFPPMFIKKMSVLSWFGLIGSIFYGIGCTILITILFTKVGSAKYENIKPEFSFTDIFIGYGVTMNSFNHHLGIPSMEVSMKKPHQLNKITNFAFGASTVVKIFLAFAGAALFGENTSGSFLSNITNPVAGALMNTAIAISMFFVYPFYIFVSLESIEPEIYNSLPSCHKYKHFKFLLSIFCRVSVAIFIYTIAASVPTFEMVTSFVGNIRGTFTGIVLPVYFYITLFKTRMSLASYVMHVLLIVFAIIFGLSGIVASVSGIISRVK